MDYDITRDIVCNTWIRDLTKEQAFKMEELMLEYSRTHEDGNGIIRGNSVKMANCWNLHLFKGVKHRLENKSYADMYIRIREIDHEMKSIAEYLIAEVEKEEES